MTTKFVYIPSDNNGMLLSSLSFHKVAQKQYPRNILLLSSGFGLAPLGCRRSQNFGIGSGSGKLMGERTINLFYLPAGRAEAGADAEPNETRQQNHVWL